MKPAPNIDQIGQRIRQFYDVLKNCLVGHSVSVVGRPELTGTIAGVWLNPQGVVIATIVTPKPNPRRLRLPLSILTVGARVEPKPARRKSMAHREIARPPSMALRNGRVAL